MATCKDCIHYEPCKDSYYNAEQLSRFPLGFLEKENAEKNCGFFKDRSKFIELPCKLGDVQKLVDKATPKKVVLTISTIRCPSCNKQLTNRGCSHSDYKFCRWCGQAIDWSEV